MEYFFIAAEPGSNTDFLPNALAALFFILLFAGMFYFLIIYRSDDE